MRRLSHILSITLVVLLLAVVVVPLATHGQSKPPTIAATSSVDGLQAFACKIAGWLFTAAIIFSIILIILTGIQYMRAGGDPEKFKAAHSKLLYIVVGIAIALIARTMPTVVSTLIGAKGGSGLDVCAGKYVS